MRLAAATADRGALLGRSKPPKLGSPSRVQRVPSQRARAPSDPLAAARGSGRGEQLAHLKPRSTCESPGPFRRSGTELRTWLSPRPVGLRFGCPLSPRLPPLTLHFPAVHHWRLSETVSAPLYHDRRGTGTAHRMVVGCGLEMSRGAAWLRGGREVLTPGYARREAAVRVPAVLACVRNHVVCR